MDYDTIDLKNNKATVQLRESHQVVFEATAPTISEMANLQHTITLHYKNEGWLIYKDEYQDDLAQEMGHVTKNDILKQVDKNYQAQFQSQAFTTPPQVVAPLFVQHTDNRSAAYNYAEAWALWTNSYYPRVPSGDCASFVSQAMYAGMGFSPPNMSGMGTVGDNTQWYYNFNNNQYSSPWAGVPSQFSFLIRTGTSKKGPFGTESYSNCAVQFSDVVQIIDPSAPGSNTWNHEAILVHAGNPCNYLSSKTIDAHDNDHKDYPLSNWASYTLHYILINGWYGN